MPKCESFIISVITKPTIAIIIMPKAVILLIVLNSLQSGFFETVKTRLLELMKAETSKNFTGFHSPLNL